MAGIINSGYKHNLYTVPSNTVKTMPDSNSRSDIRRLLTNLKNEEKGITNDSSDCNTALNSNLSYGESLRMQRQQAKDTSLKMKKLKYQFKDISSQILRSKTSSTARQVVNKAKREVLRLKREKQSGNYDSEEIEAAIAHAKTMERIAKKKVKHLEEEEMAKSSGGPCAGDMIDNEEQLSDREYSGDISEEGSISESADSDFINSKGYGSDSIDYMMSLMDDLSAELFDEFSEEMRELLEEMGFDELSKGIMSSNIEMDPEDKKSMESNHRNKEMKEIVKADAEYLKALFEHFQKLRAGGVIPGMGNASNSAPISADAAPAYVASGGGMAAPVIDITL